jgi:hypothetical protein
VTLNLDQAVQLVQVWDNAAGISKARMAAPNNITDAGFVAIVQEAWDQMVAIVNPEEPS